MFLFQSMDCDVMRMISTQIRSLLIALQVVSFLLRECMGSSSPHPPPPPVKNHARVF